MSRGEHIHKLAEWSGKGESPGMHKILECAMTDEEARFLLDLPAASKPDLAARYGMNEDAVEEKLLDLARRGLVVSSRKGIRYPRNPTTLHDNILASAEAAHSARKWRKLWMDLYDGERWGEEIGHGLASFGITALRTIPAQGSVLPEIELLPQESIEKIIEANKDLISVRQLLLSQRLRRSATTRPRCAFSSAGGRSTTSTAAAGGRSRRVKPSRSLSRPLQSGLVPTVTNISRHAGARIHLLLLRLLLSRAGSGRPSGGHRQHPRAEPLRGQGRQQQV